MWNTWIGGLMIIASVILVICYLGVVVAALPYFILGGVVLFILYCIVALIGKFL